ncbi:MAG TPA: type IV secretion system DNA-binding domain-containing protein [Steroidobacteraceae bacterium]|nr:type IV secretion system DNA-binding domain-containing protein [Steroidobacteraceae bacterium]
MNPVILTAALTTAAVGCAKLIARRMGSRERETYKRGVMIADGAPWQRRSARRKKSSPELITLAGVAIPQPDESKHFKVIGTTGTGKSTAIRELLGAAIARGDRAVFADPDAGFLERFYDRHRGDIILNPFERESARWNPFAEIRDTFDVEHLARGLIPDCADAGAREWRGYARTFLSAVLRYCRFSGTRQAVDLWNLAMVAPAEELRSIVAGTPAQPFLDPDNARMFGSIRAVMGSAIAAFEYIARQRAVPFSVREWVRDRAYPSLLFIPYRAGQIAALRSLIATWMHLAIFEAMSQSQHDDQRLWFVIDELDALGAIDGLKDALARLRKFGCRCVLGFQSAAQVSGTYGDADAHTILENCGTTLILRCSGSEHGGTSQFASRLIGEREVLRRQVSRGKDRENAFSSRGVRRSRSITDQRVTETAVMASELEQLPDLCGYLKGASSAMWLKVKLARG